MGQCTSRKAAGAFAASAAVSHKRPKKMQKNKSPDEDNKRSPIGEDRRLLPLNSNKKLPPGCTKGVAMSFGFKRRPVTAPSIASNATAARRLANSGAVYRKDRNGNEESDTDALTSNIAATGRSTPRLVPPKKEAGATTKVSRFGFRQSPTDRLNRVADLNAAHRPVELGAVKNTSPTGEYFQFQSRNNLKRQQPGSRNENAVITGINAKPNDNNRNNNTALIKDNGTKVSKFTFQATQLPRPEAVRVIESKTAKTLANNNKRSAGTLQQNHQEETSSKDGSLTEDSGVGSHHSGCLGDNDTAFQELDRLESSPTFGVKKRNTHKMRSLELIVTSQHTFNLREMNDSNDSIESCAPPPLPQLPSAFQSASPYQNTGQVREKANSYQRRLTGDGRSRKISITSSDGFSDEYGEEEKTFKDKFRSEKSFMKFTPGKMFLKSKTMSVKEADSSPPSSDEHDWVHGGEAMADDISVTMSSSDESKDKKDDDSDNNSIPTSTAVIGTVLQTLATTSSTSTTFTQSTKDVKSVLLCIEDPNFAAVASSTTGSLLDDEMLSPVESLVSCSDTEELLKRKLARSSSNSKDVNEKLTPSTPGTPTNATNSLSLSDGKDDFLIDDEIADQPALVFEDTITNESHFSASQNNSENTPTIKDNTPKPKRRFLTSVEGSPLALRNRKILQSRTNSLDTLSPCESIASDDLMMDYDVSQSSGLDDCDRHSNGYSSLNDAVLKPELTDRASKDWILSTDKISRSSVPKPRLLSRSRTGTPVSISDSPRSLDSRLNFRPRPASTSNLVKPRFVHDSDTDSFRLDKANHTAIKQDISSTMALLLKLKRVLNESETHNPFESQPTSANGVFTPVCQDFEHAQNGDTGNEAKLELADLRRQILFLQGQLEDKEKTVQNLQEQVVQLVNQNYHSNSAPASTVASDRCNAATQTERIRPISAGPSLLGSSSMDETSASLVSASESKEAQRKPHFPPNGSKRSPTVSRQSGEISSYSSSIPKRAASRSRPSASVSS